MLTKARMRGLVGGAFILTLFGGYWAIGTFVFWKARPMWAIPLASVVTVLLLAVCVMRWRTVPTLPSTNDPSAVQRGKRAGILFGIVFGIEAGLIALVATLLARSHHGEWIPIAVALIVGLHFLPLASVFEAPVYYWTGALSVAGVLACLAIPNSSLRLLCVGSVMASVLWLTAALLLLKTRLLQA